MEAKELTNFVTDKAVALIRALHKPPIGAKEFSGGWCPDCGGSCFETCLDEPSKQAMIEKWNNRKA